MDQTRLKSGNIIGPKQLFSFDRRNNDFFYRKEGILGWLHMLAAMKEQRSMILEEQE